MGDTFKPERRYLGAWSYALLGILYAIPVIGWICLLVHCFSVNSNKPASINRMHYARSYFAHLLLGVILLVLLAVVFYLTIGPEGIMEYVETVQTQIENFGEPVPAPNEEAIFPTTLPTFTFPFY